MDNSGHLPGIPGVKEDGYIYPIFLTPSESDAPVLRTRNKHLQEPLQRPIYIQLMELRLSTYQMENATNSRVVLYYPRFDFLYLKD